MGLLEDFVHQRFIDRCGTKHITLQDKLICRLFYLEERLANPWCLLFKCFGNLTTIDGWIHGEQPLSGTDEISIGMAHPELAHMPGKVCDGTHDVCLGLLSLAIDCIGILDEQDDLSA